MTRAWLLVALLAGSARAAPPPDDDALRPLSASLRHALALPVSERRAYLADRHQADPLVVVVQTDDPGALSAFVVQARAPGLVQIEVSPLDGTSAASRAVDPSGAAIPRGGTLARRRSARAIEGPGGSMPPGDPNSPLRSLIGGAAAGLDRGLVAGLGALRALRTTPGESLGPDQRIDRLRALAARYDRPEWRDPDVFFPVPEVTARETGVRAPFWHTEVVDLSWDRDYEPVGTDIAAEYLGHRVNLRFVARWFRVGGPRPVVVLIHGYQGGRFEWEQRVFPVRRLLAAGFDVVLPALPFHGPRREAGVTFPAVDPRWTIEGFRLVVTDLRALVGLLRDRGAPHVGVWGISLGGYTAALLATAERALDFAVPIVPLASVADYARQHGRLIGTPEQVSAQHGLLEAVYGVVSPLARAPRVPADRMLVLAGRADRITGPSHAERLAAHLGCRLETFDGGHLLQIGLRERLEHAIAVSTNAT